MSLSCWQLQIRSWQLAAAGGRCRANGPQTGKLCQISIIMAHQAFLHRQRHTNFSTPSMAFFQPISMRAKYQYEYGHNLCGCLIGSITDTLLLQKHPSHRQPVLPVQVVRYRAREWHTCTDSTYEAKFTQKNRRVICMHVDEARKGVFDAATSDNRLRLLALHTLLTPCQHQTGPRFLRTASFYRRGHSYIPPCEQRQPPASAHEFAIRRPTS